MKKFFALLLALTMLLTVVGCADTTSSVDSTPSTASTASTPAAPATVMTHDEYIAAAMDSAVTVETYVQATQSWWDNKITVYCQSPDGAYFAYEMACTEADAACGAVRGPCAGRVSPQLSALRAHRRVRRAHRRGSDGKAALLWHPGMRGSL